MAKDVKFIDKFGGPGSGAHNVLATALVECARDDGFDGEYAEYEWLEKIPRTSLVVAIVNKLRELGYDIKKIDNV